MKFIELEKTENIFQVILNRPKKKNSLNLEMIVELSETFKDLEKNDECKLVIIKGAGSVFSAGADLNWMKDQINQSFEENLKESNQLFDMFLNLTKVTKPVITYVHKYVMGGALGLVACSDYCFAEDDTQFCFSETKLGLAPSVIAPFILSKCDASLAKRLMMFAEFFNSRTATELGLVHETLNSSDLKSAFDNHITRISHLDLNAVGQTKKLINEIKELDFENYRNRTTSLISKLRVEDEAQTRLKKFLEKNKS